MMTDDNNGKGKYRSPNQVVIGKENKAVYTTAPVAGGWAGAVISWAGAEIIWAGA